MRSTGIRARWRAFVQARPRFASHLAVGAAAAVVAVIVAALRAAAPETPVFLLFAPVVCASAVLGGLGPALLAAAIGLAAGVWLGESATATWVFAGLGAGVAFAGDRVFRTRARDDRATRALAEREAHLRSIYDTAPDALIVIDENGIVQSYSAAAERMFGWREAEVLGKNVKMLMPTVHRNAHDGYIGHYLETGERRIIGIGRIVVGERKDGATFPMELAVGEVRSERGRVFTGFVRDLTERQATETRLQELQAELVHMSRLTAMGEMASALAHELNQPLSAISNYLSGARRLIERAEALDERAIDAMDRASEQALRAGEIIRRLRDFLARGETERTVESLPRLVQEACALALVGAKERGVRVQYALSDQAELVLVDRVPVQQVIINLVRNAIDAMEGQARRELLVTTGRASDGFAEVSVADSGSGVDAATAEKLFQPFVTTKPQGMGVGLSISRTIVEAHGGRIWFEPRAGGGTVFKFTIRLAEPEPQDA